MKRSLMRRMTAGVLVMILLITAAGCAGGQDPDNEILRTEDELTEAEPPVKGPSGVERDNRHDISAVLTLDKDGYSEGETIGFELQLTNGYRNHYVVMSDVEYQAGEGMGAAEGTTLPFKIDKVYYGETGSAEGAFGPDQDVTTLKNKKTSGGVTGDFEEVKLRPYVKVMYAGTEITVRAVMELHVYMDRILLRTEDKLKVSTITCHDPSIFKDFDGTYYLLGTHITGGYSKDLLNWTSIDNSFRATFTEETRAKIREWNKDSGSWFGYLWAPDVVYNPVLGKYCYYLSANGDDWKSNIVMLTSDSVTGPYEYAGSVVYGGFVQADLAATDVPRVLGSPVLPQRYITNGIANKKWGDKWPNCIDPCVFYDEDGRLWMSYGSWSGGIFLLKLDEKTGLRDYSVTYPENEHSDPYFGQKIAGGAYVSGEGSYIHKIGDYYYLFISYGNLEAAGGYNIRVFRSDRPDGRYVDELGNSAFYDSYVFNYNQSVGVRLFGGYKWRTFNVGQVAQGHNSVFTDDDGRSYIVFHTRTSNGTEGHYVKVHQLFVNEDGWLVAAPYQTNGESLPAEGMTASEIAGNYDVIMHRLTINYKKLETVQPVSVTLTPDGRLEGDMEGTWSVVPGTSDISLVIDSKPYVGKVLKMKVENSNVETVVFTVLGRSDQLTVWGSRCIYE